MWFASSWVEGLARSLSEVVGGGGPRALKTSRIWLHHSRVSTSRQPFRDRTASRHYQDTIYIKLYLGYLCVTLIYSQVAWEVSKANSYECSLSIMLSEKSSLLSPLGAVTYESSSLRSALWLPSQLSPASFVLLNTCAMAFAQINNDHEVVTVPIYVQLYFPEYSLWTFFNWLVLGFALDSLSLDDLETLILVAL